MDLSIRKFSEKDIDRALDIFLGNYADERDANPDLPCDVMNDPKRISDSLSKVEKPGVVAHSNGRIVGFMLTGATFRFKGQKTAMVPEYCHGSVRDNKTEIYRRMHMALSEEWVNEGCHLHIIGHLAHDAELKETLFQLGFGAVVSEKVRDLSPVKTRCTHDIVRVEDPKRLIDLQLEHNMYYRDSPIFIKKPIEMDVILKDLEEHAANGDVFFAHREGDELMGYMIIGESARGHEGFLLQNTRTAQIKSAYLKSEARGKEIGKCLLKECVEWARSNGYERIFVEHETANYYGGNFWERHFKSYLYYSMRYVDNTV